jgi:hypothetical protein
MNIDENESEIWEIPPDLQLNIIENEDINLLNIELSFKNNENIKSLINIYTSGSIKGTVGDLDISKLDINNLQSSINNLNEYKIDIYHALNENEKTFINEVINCCNIIILIRIGVKDSNWLIIEDELNKINNKINNLVSVKDIFKDELNLLLNEILDRNARNNFLKSFNIGQVLIDDYNIPIIKDVNNDSLINAIQISNELKMKSFETEHMKITAIILYYLRQSIINDNWEIEGLYCSNISCDNLTKYFQENDNHPSIITENNINRAEYDNIELNTIKSINIIENLGSLSNNINIQELINNFSIDKNDIMLNVSELLLIAHDVGFHDAALNELRKIRRASFERRSRSILLLSTSIGKINGSLEGFNTDLIRVDDLISAISYTKLYSSYTSEVITNWVVCAQELLRVRISLKLLTNDFQDVCSCMVPSELSTIINNTNFNFPVNELWLVFDIVSDIVYFNDIIAAIYGGRSRLYLGKFDSSNLEFENLIYLTENIKKRKSKSNRLDRLMFYAELCISVRKLISQNEWDLEKSSLYSRVRKILREFKQAEVFFSREKILNVPPKCMQDEFNLIQLEWDRRIVLKHDPDPFLIGATAGSILSLELNNINIDALKTQIEAFSQWEKKVDHVDLEIVNVKNAMSEIVVIRNELQNLNNKYIRLTNFQQDQSNSIQDIISSSLIDDSISNAIENVINLSTTPNYIITEWEPVYNLLTSNENICRFPRSSGEIALLLAESFMRDFIGKSLTIFSNFEMNLNDNYRNIDIDNSIISSLFQLSQSYETRFNDNTVGVIKTIDNYLNSIGNIIYNSVVLLLHLCRAYSCNLFDKNNINWKIDPGFVKTPRLNSLINNQLTHTYSIQALVRASFHIDVHCRVKQQLNKLTNKIEDEVTYNDLTEALKVDYTLNKVGNIIVNSNANDEKNILKSSLERVNVIGFCSKEVSVIYNAAIVIDKLRSSIMNEPIDLVLDIVDGACNSGLRDFKSLLTILYSPNINIHKYAMNEFVYLSIEVCDRKWINLAISALNSNYIVGNKSELTISDISINSLNEVLEYLDIHKEISIVSNKLQFLCFLVRKVRMDVIQTYNDRNDGVEVSSINSYISIEVTTKEVINYLNINKDLLSPTISSGLINECNLINSHCEFMKALVSLELSLCFQCISFSCSGLETVLPIQNNIIQSIKLAKEQEWLPTSSNCENYAVTFLNTALKLINISEVISNNNIMIPGKQENSQFLNMLEELINDIDLSVSTLTIAQKNFTFIKSLLSIKSCFEKFISEEKNIFIYQNLIQEDKIILISNAVNDADNDELVYLDISYKNNDENINNEIKYNGNDLEISMDNLRVVSFNGIILKKLALLHIKLRSLTLNKNWSDAYGIANLIISTDLLNLYHSDSIAVLEFCNINIVIKSMELGIVNCIIPPILGWSLISSVSTLSFSINDSSLKEALELLNSRYSSFINKFFCIKELYDISIFILELVASIRSCNWLFISDQDNTDNQLTTMTFIDDVAERHVELTNSLKLIYLKHSNKSVKDILIKFESCVNISTYLHSYLKEYIIQLIDKTKTEFKVQEIEAEFKHIYANLVGGCAGNISCNNDVLYNFYNFIEKLETDDKYYIDNCCHISSSYQTSKVISSICKSLQDNNHNKLQNLIGVLLNMASISIVRSNENVYEKFLIEEKKYYIFDESILTLNDTIVKDQIDEMTKKLCDLQSTSLENNIENSLKITAMPENLSILAIEIFGDIECIHLIRHDAISILELFQNHYSFIVEFELFQKTFMLVKDMKNMTSSEMFNNINIFSSIKHKLIQKGLTNDDDQLTPSYLLKNTVNSFYLFNRGQITGNMKLIEEALAILSQIRLDEVELWGKTSQISMECVSFIPYKNWLSAFNEDFDNFKNLYNETNLIILIKLALNTNGIVLTDDYNINVDLIETIELVNVNESCQQNQPISDEAIILWNTVDKILTIRSYAIEKNWLKIEEYVECIDIKEIHDSVILEVYAAKKLAIISYSLEYAMKTYLSGRVELLHLSDNGGNNNMEVDISKVNIMNATIACEYFNKVNVDWMTKNIISHQNSCRLLYQLRCGILDFDWHIVYDTCKLALNENRLKVKFIVDDAIDEIKLLFNISSFRIRFDGLNKALFSNKMTGSIGCVDTSSISAICIKNSLSLSQSVGTSCPSHKIVSQLEQISALIFQLRQAQLIGKWISYEMWSKLRDNHTNLCQDNTIECEIINYIMKDVTQFNHYNVSSRSILASDIINGVEKEENKDCMDYINEIFDLTLEIDTDLKSIFMNYDNNILNNDWKTFLSVEEIIQNINNVIKVNDIQIDSVVENEIQFAKDELNYRIICIKLLEAMKEPGITGQPGNLNLFSRNESILKSAIEFANNFSNISNSFYCGFLLRDANLLFSARTFCCAGDWNNLNLIICKADDINSKSNVENNVDLIYPIILPVWNEISLLKGELKFHICLYHFLSEMDEDFLQTKIRNFDNKHFDIEKFGSLKLDNFPLNVDDLNNDVLAGDDVELTEKIKSILKIQLFIERNCNIYPSPDFNRLLEAVNISVEVRIYGQLTQDPKNIIQRIKASKVRDEHAGAKWYMEVVMNECLKLDSSFNKQQHLDVIFKKVLEGQIYFNCRLGEIDVRDIEVENLSILINKVKLLVDDLWTISDKDLLDLAMTILILRGSIQKGWDNVKVIISNHESILSSPIINDEISRLKLEIENSEICNKLDYNLRQGRFLDIIKLAKIIAKTRTNAMVSGKNNKRRSNLYGGGSSRRRLSNLVNIPPVLEDGAHALQQTLVEASKIVHRSNSTNKYIRAGYFILNLRMKVTNSCWDEVEYLIEEENFLELPEPTVEEIKSIKASLSYRTVMSQISTAFTKGKITGVAGNITLSTLEYNDLESALHTLSLLGVNDDTSKIVHDIGTKISLMRQAVFESRWSLYDSAITTTGSEDDISNLISTQVTNETNLPTVEDIVTSFIANSNEIMDRLKESLGIDETDVGEGLIDWVMNLWIAVCSVQEEMLLVQTELKERNLTKSLIECIQLVPALIEKIYDNTFSRNDKIIENEDYNSDDNNIQSIERVTSDDYTYQQTSMYYKKHIVPLEKILKSCHIYKDEVSEDTRKLIDTSALILKFRKALSIVDMENFSLLLEELYKLDMEGVLSRDYGVNELNIMRSTSIIVMLAKNEISKALNIGRIRGYLDEIDTSYIDTRNLAYWITSANSILESNTSLSIDLQSLVKEAKIILKVRSLIKENDLTNSYIFITNLKSKNKNNFQFIKDEINYVESVYKLKSIRNVLNEIFEDEPKLHLENEYSQLLVLIQPLEDALNDLSEILLYSSSMIDKDKLLYNRSSVDILMKSGTSLLNLWKSISIQNWGVENIASGKMLLLPNNPKDILLNIFFNLIRQYEVIDKFNAVHEQLLLKFNSSKENIKNKSNGETRSRRISIVQNSISNESITPKELSKHKKRASVSYVALNLNEDHLSFNNDKIDSKNSSISYNTTSVAKILSEEEWTNFPPRVVSFFNKCRNLLIDQVIRSRILYSCIYGKITLDCSTGGVAIPSDCNKLIRESISDAKIFLNEAKHYSYLGSSLNWTPTTNNILTIGLQLCKCRSLLIDGNIDDLITLLESIGYLGKYKTQSTMVSPNVKGEFLLIESFALESFAEKFVKDIIARLSKLTVYNKEDFQVIINLIHSLVFVPQSMRNPTPYYSELIIIAKQLRRALKCVILGEHHSLEAIEKLIIHTIDLDEYQHLVFFKDELKLIFNKLESFNLDLIESNKLTEEVNENVTNINVQQLDYNINIKKMIIDCIMEIGNLSNKTKASFPYNNLGISIVQIGKVRSIIEKINNNKIFCIEEPFWSLIINIIYIIFDKIEHKNNVKSSLYNVRQFIIPKSISRFIFSYIEKYHNKEVFSNYDINNDCLSFLDVSLFLNEILSSPSDLLYVDEINNQEFSTSSLNLIKSIIEDNIKLNAEYYLKNSNNVDKRRVVSTLKLLSQKFK